MTGRVIYTCKIKKEDWTEYWKQNRDAEHILRFSEQNIQCILWLRVLISCPYLWVYDKHTLNPLFLIYGLGWGGPGGYVYQKAYVEFFCSKEKLDTLVDKCKDRTFLTYMAVNKEGCWKSNVGQTDVNAVTWGVFPAKEIKQPTIVDPVSFNVWKDEAFEIWSRGWASLYPEGDASRKFVEEVSS